MGRSAHERWQGKVLARLDHKVPAVRAEAARAAGELEIHEARQALLDMLEDPDPEARSASIWALSQVGGEGVREALEALYERTEDEEEAEFIDTALDNLSFTEDIQLFSLMDFSEDGELEDTDNPEDDEDQ
jgi:HEAT repeat protein